MIKLTLTYLSCVLLATAACNSDNNAGSSAAWQPPKPGTLITSAEQPVTDDPLNKFNFSVKVIADSNVATGVYDIDADYGPNFAESKMTLPKGGEHFTPAIRRSDKPYTYIIGFRMPDDTMFYDYYEVSSSRGQTMMRYIKAYSF